MYGAGESQLLPLMDENVARFPRSSSSACRRFWPTAGAGSSSACAVAVGGRPRRVRASGRRRRSRRVPPGRAGGGRPGRRRTAADRAPCTPRTATDGRQRHVVRRRRARRLLLAHDHDHRDAPGAGRGADRRLQSAPRRRRATRRLALRHRASCTACSPARSWARRSACIFHGTAMPTSSTTRVQGAGARRRHTDHDLDGDRDRRSPHGGGVVCSRLPQSGRHRGRRGRREDPAASARCRSRGGGRCGPSRACARGRRARLGGCRQPAVSGAGPRHAASRARTRRPAPARGR